MSGAFGWGGKDRAADRNSSNGTAGFGSAYGAYQQPASPGTRGGALAGAGVMGADSVATPRPGGAAAASPVDLSPKDLAAEADNVLIVSMDVTGSMGDWRDEIYRRMPLLYKEAQALLGQSLAVLFVAFGDVKFGDKIWVTRFGAGPELDALLDSLPRSAGGGGDEEESPELVALYVLTRVDVSRARNIYFWTITDERPAEQIDPQLAQQYVGVQAPPAARTTKAVFDALALKMRPFVVLKRADSGVYDPDRIRGAWERARARSRARAAPRRRPARRRRDAGGGRQDHRPDRRLHRLAPGAAGRDRARRRQHRDRAALGRPRAGRRRPAPAPRRPLQVPAPRRRGADDDRAPDSPQVVDENASSDRSC